jgi:hypothetical protein
MLSKMYRDPEDYCKSHAPHLIYRPKGVRLDNNRKHYMNYKPYCATRRYWDREKLRCSKYHAGHLKGRCECWTAGCMPDRNQCVPYDERNQSAQETNCNLNHGLMVMCGAHLPGGTQSANWREACLREQGFRCRLDGASHSDRQSTACVPNSDPHGAVHVPDALTRDPAKDMFRVQYFEEGTALRKNDLARMRNPRNRQVWVDVMVQRIHYNARGMHSYTVVSLEDDQEYHVPEDELIPTHVPKQRHAYDSTSMAAEKMWQDMPQAGEQVTVKRNQGHGYAATVISVDRHGFTLQYRDGHIDKDVSPTDIASRTWKDAIPHAGQQVVLRTGKDRGAVVRVVEADLSGLTVKHEDGYVQRVNILDVEHHASKDLTKDEIENHIDLLKRNLYELRNENRTREHQERREPRGEVPCRSNQTDDDCRAQENCEYSTRYGCVEKPVFLGHKKRSSSRQYSGLR